MKLEGKDWLRPQLDTADHITETVKRSLALGRVWQDHKRGRQGHGSVHRLSAPCPMCWLHAPLHASLHDSVTVTDPHSSLTTSPADRVVSCLELPAVVTLNGLGTPGGLLCLHLGL